MTTVSELLASAAQSSNISDALDAGLDTIAGQQEITFVKYIRTPLPLDGSVFWVRADLVDAATMVNPTQTGPNPVASTATIVAHGSLHRATDQRQDEDQTINTNSIVFTSESEIQPLSEVSPIIMWLGAFEGVRFAFAHRNSYFAQANKHHYVGEAVHPQLLSQIIDSIADVSELPVVSNSLPIWMSIGAWFPIYPSYLLPANLQPPYAVISVIGSSQRALQAVPFKDKDSTRWQLLAERVTVTMIGLRNDDAVDFLDDVVEFCAEGDQMGVMNMPVVRDEKRTQVELTTVAMKKTIEFDVCYYQARARAIARGLIVKAIPTYINP